MSADANVVQLRVQVIDLNAFTLDLQVPRYLPAKDVSQRIARDAGLEAFWANNKRRLYYLRARGRLLGESETLQDIGVVDGELVYLLPEPPPDGQVVEQVPEYPETHDYPAAGWGPLIGTLALMMAWALGWGWALVHDRGLLTVLLPGLGLGFLAATLSRHAFGGKGTELRIPVLAMFLHTIITVLAFIPPLFLSGTDLVGLLVQGIPGLIVGYASVFIGWLSWWGAVPPLPRRAAQPQGQVTSNAAQLPCNICGLPVDTAVQSFCRHGCGRIFHSGCYAAKTAVYRGDPSLCAICGVVVAQPPASG